MQRRELRPVKGVGFTSCFLRRRWGDGRMGRENHFLLTTDFRYSHSDVKRRKLYSAAPG